MTKYSEIESSSAEWVQPRSGVRHFELRANDTLVGILNFRSSTGTHALAEGARGRWTCKRVGFFSIGITIREEGADADLALFKPDIWGRGSLAFNDGSSYAWRSTNVWRTTWELTDASKQPVVRFRPGVQGQKLRDTFKSQATVTIEAGAPSDERLFILLSFGMYMLAGQEVDETAVLLAAIG
jgi:hypothetical protein